MDRNEIIKLLNLKGEDMEDLFKKARDKRNNIISNKTYLRGLIEISNICDNDCFYCGIRKSNKKIKRYILDKKIVLESVKKSYDLGMKSVVLQSGERRGVAFTEYVEDLVKNISDNYPDIRIVLSLGEHERGVYDRWFKAGARRYLLRIETANKDHYKKLHPENMDFEKRKQCLENLRKIGFQVGTGVMICSPYQDVENLADDIIFFKKLDVDMVGMGPYMFHGDTPMAEMSTINLDEDKLNLSLKMIAILRLVMPDINIAATTALEALHPKGRMLGLKAGANVIMPLITPEDVKANYNLYENKTLEKKGFSVKFDSVVRDIEVSGMIPALEEPGDSLHYQRRFQVVKND